jgi:hypothetical protein
MEGAVELMQVSNREVFQKIRLMQKEKEVHFERLQFTRKATSLELRSIPKPVSSIFQFPQGVKRLG